MGKTPPFASVKYSWRLSLCDTCTFIFLFYYTYNEKFKFILNNIGDNFTKFELMEFTTLYNSYSNTAYRLLKQFKQSGYYIVQIDEFVRILDIPKSYQMSDKKKVL